MNYNYLRYFSVLAQTEHYTLAAARLEISQPSLSSAIHHLEDELGGVKLFEKVGRNIRLTEEGRFFREQVDAALQKLNNATMTLPESRVSAPVVIKLGLVSGTLGGAVAREITRYATENDRIRFQLTESSADELMDLVRQEKLDMAVVDTTNRDRTLHFRKLYQQNYFVALPSEHPLASEEQIAPARVRQERQVVFNRETENSFGQWASGAVAAENTVCSVNTAQAALELVAAGAGVCLVPESCVNERENIRFVEVENRHQALYMCILYDKWLEPPVWEFVEKLVKILRNQSL